MLESLSRRLGGSGDDGRRLPSLRIHPSQNDLAQFIAAQIRDEQNLSSVRMNWNLTFQGFTLAGYAVLAAAEKTSPARFLIQLAVAVFASVIALTTWQALVASQHQRTYLKKAWAAASLSLFFPEPFSNPAGSRLGRRSAEWICLSTLLMWLVLGVAAVWDRNLNNEPDKVKVQVAGSLQLTSPQTSTPPTAPSTGTTPAPQAKAPGSPAPKKAAS